MSKVLIKFGAVGLINTALDFSIVQILAFVFDIKSGIFLLLANTFSASVAMINSFFLNKKWTFEDKEERYIKQFLVFILVNLFSIVINDTIVLSLSNYVPHYVIVYHHFLQSLLFTKVIAIVFTMIFNFFAYKLFVFKPAVEANIT